MIGCCKSLKEEEPISGRLSNFVKPSKERLKEGRKYLEKFGKSDIQIEPLVMIEGQRGSKIACVEGYFFYKDDGEIYRCKYYKKGCNVRVRIRGDTFEYKQGSFESHLPHPSDYFNYLQKKKNFF